MYHDLTLALNSVDFTISHHADTKKKKKLAVDMTHYKQSDLNISVNNGIP